MTISFITSRNSLKLFSLGNYTYEICRNVNGEIVIVKKLYNADFETALAIFNEMTA